MERPSQVRELATPDGPARALIDAAEPVRSGTAPSAGVTLVLGHGAGSGANAGSRSRDLVALATALPARGITVVRLEQPWLVAGRRVAAPPPVLDRCWLAALEELAVTGPLVLGGRSAGARVACRTAAALNPIGVLALAFPLHPPGRPDRSRVEEVTNVRRPLLVVQGERDSFGRPGEFPGDLDLRAVPGADHGFRVPASADPGQAGTLASVAEIVQTWIAGLLAAPAPRRGRRARSAREARGVG